MEKKELELYQFAMPKLELSDNLKVGLESFGVITNFLDKVMDAFDDVKNKLHIFNTLYRDKNINELKELNAVKSKIDAILKRIEYVDVKDKEVNGLAGLVSLVDASKKLQALMDYTNDNTLPALKKGVEVFDKFITDEDFRKSFTKGENELDRFRWSNGSKNWTIEMEIASFVDLTVINDTVKIGSIIPNLFTIKTIHEDMTKTAKASDVSNLKEIEDTIAIIENKTKLIIEILNNNDGSDIITKRAASAVGDALTELGHMIRFHSLIYYLTAEVSKIVINLIYTLDKIKK